MDPAQMGGHPGARHLGHPGPPHYAPGPSPHGVVAPLYPSMAPTQGPTGGVKRPRPDDLDLSVPGMPDLEQGDIDSMQQTSMSAAYAQAPPTHHHHRLPDTGPPSKMMRRDGDGGGGGGGGAPSVVGQAGMPPPAPRPRGPKLKFTPEDDQLLIDLKENKSLTWKQIADFFPGRSSGTLQVRYCTKLKAKTTQWTDETVGFPASCGLLGGHGGKGLFADSAVRCRTKSFAQRCKTTRTRSGASWPTKWARDLRLLPAARGPRSWSVGTYSNQRPRRELRLPSLGTPTSINSRPLTLPPPSSPSSSSEPETTKRAKPRHRRHQGPAGVTNPAVSPGEPPLLYVQHVRLRWASTSSRSRILSKTLANFPLRTAKAPHGTRGTTTVRLHSDDKRCVITPLCVAANRPSKAG